jgi:hypothetical protein
LSKLKKTVAKVTAKTKQAVAEVIGDAKLAEEGKRQEKRAKEEDEAKPDLAKIANNLT